MAQDTPPTALREQVNAVLWTQTAVEYKGAALMAYRYAENRLPTLRRASAGTASVEQQEAGGYANKRPAIVLDIDETVLDNSAYNATLIRAGNDTQAYWENWVLLEQAREVPGARAFIQKARSLKFRVVFVSNRNYHEKGAYDAQGRSLECPQKASTLNNLEKILGYRPLESDLILRADMKGRDDRDKKERRTEIAKTNRIAMLIGDDLNDFVRRVEYVEGNDARKWGHNWIVIPNPMYGS